MAYPLNGEMAVYPIQQTLRGRSAYLRISHSSPWIPVPHFRMGLLDGLTPVFCSSQPHRPDAAQGAAAALATYIREGCGGPAVSHAEPRQRLLFGAIAD